MMHGTAIRFAAGAGMVGAIILAVFSALHPRSADIGAESLVRLAGQGGVWAIVHYMIGWGFALALVALVGLSRSFSTDPSASWGRIALPVAIGSTAIAVATVGVDGFAMRVAAQEASSEVALAVAYAGMGVSVATVASFFGLTPVLFGVAVAVGEDYRRWLGWIPIVSGLLGLAGATIIFFAGLVDLVANILFPISSAIFVVWIGIMSYLLWRKVAHAGTHRSGI